MSAISGPPSALMAGRSSDQNILKLGAAILLRLGRLIQIWKSSKTFSESSPASFLKPFEAYVAWISYAISLQTIAVKPC